MSGSNYKIIKVRPGAYRLQAAAPDAATDSAGAVAVAGCSAAPCQKLSEDACAVDNSDSRQP